MGNSLLWGSKLINPNPLKQQKDKSLNLLAKSIITQKIKLGAPIFLRILYAVRLGFVHIPDIGPIPYQIIEQKLVQCCETYIEAQACIYDTIYNVLS